MKHPWQMLRADFLANVWERSKMRPQTWYLSQPYPHPTNSDINRLLKMHHFINVKLAVQHGKPVPLEVRADYPQHFAAN